MKNKRLLKLVRTHLIIGITGIIYAVVCYITGHGIPCIFREVTGFKCPGCGISRMCLEMFKLNVSRAISYNFCLAVISPVIIYLYIRVCMNYVNGKGKNLNRTDTILAYAVCGVLIAWMVIRNIYNI